jgi:GDPmannose 4,6-dehydratase
MKSAIVTGVSGQTGSYLCEHLLYDKDEPVKVYGVSRRLSDRQEYKYDFMYHENYEPVTLDITDSSGMRNLIGSIKPDYFFNLAAQSHVGQSFSEPLSTLMADGYAVTAMLEGIRLDSPETKFLQASTSEMFGNNGDIVDGKLIQDINTPLCARSPYGAAKIYAHNMVNIYRQAYGIFACASICFNHESPRRSVDFVTRKITSNVAKIAAGQQTSIKLGNLAPARDFGHARDYAKAMCLMLQNSDPEDFVISTGEAVTIQEVLEYVCELAGLDWKTIYEEDPRFMRPAEVNYLCGDSNPIREKLGWSTDYDWEELLTEMYGHDELSVADSLTSNPL